MNCPRCNEPCNTVNVGWDEYGPLYEWYCCHCNWSESDDDYIFFDDEYRDYDCYDDYDDFYTSEPDYGYDYDYDSYYEDDYENYN